VAIFFLFHDTDKFGTHLPARNKLGSRHPSSSFQRKLESSFSFTHHVVMAGPLVPELDPGINPAISCQRQMRESSPRMTFMEVVPNSAQR
jgi:hypothetical protein